MRHRVLGPLRQVLVCTCIALLLCCTLGSSYADAKAIVRQDVIKLESQNGQFMGPASSNSYRYYFPQMVDSESEGGFLQIGDDCYKIKSGDLIELHSGDKETWKDSWVQRDLLGAFGDSKDLYYWSDYGDKTKWKIVKIGGQEGDQINDGDQVYLINSHYNQYLVPDGKWLTTRKNDEHKWMIHFIG